MLDNAYPSKKIKQEIEQSLLNSIVEFSYDAIPLQGYYQLES
ncbi:Uncharacterised protein [Legionella busanensis]|uniref:Uncharacterized protein n=1 Tax=Legionella busanensis TaxID=190655 RepID=A0A378KDN4_9GAMM|nr:Uncharacterised protein [Legionella busanensis]